MLNYLSVSKLQIFKILAIIFFVVACSLVLNDRFNWFDDSYYIMLAKALATGQGYYDINLPKPELHKLFPPGLSVFLTLPSLFNFDLKTSIIIFKIMLIFCAAGALLTFSHLAKQEGYKEPNITYAIVISATSITMVGHTSRVASEMLFIFLSILALICLNYYKDSANKISPYLFLSALLIVSCILTRSIGIFLLPAIFLSWIIRREFLKITLLFSLVIILMSPWVILTKKTGAGGTSRYATDMWVQYINTDSSAESSPVKAVANKLKENTSLIMIREIPRIIFSISASSFVLDNYWVNFFSLPIRLLITLLTLIPLFLELWPKPKISTIYFIFYLGVLLIWPWEPSRFLIPLIPFLLLYFFNSLEWLTEKLLSKTSLNTSLLPNVILSVAILLIFSHLVSNLRFIKTVWQTGDYTVEAAEFWKDTQSAYKWVSENLPKNSIMGCIPALEAYAYLYTERKSIALPTNPSFCKDITHIIFIDEKLVNFGKDGQSLGDFKNLVKRAGSDSFLKLVYKNNNVKIFAIDQGELKKLLDAGS